MPALTSLRPSISRNLLTIISLACLLALLGGFANAQTFSVRYAFNGGPDGSLSQPFSDLAQDAAGNLYGTTTGISCLNGCDFAPGAIFKLNSSGKLTTLHTFNCATEGCMPFSGVIGDKSGNIYGTTQASGLNGGSVYRLNATGYETLHSFTGPDGKSPQSQLLRDASGNLYGTAPAGGDSNQGVAFEISSAGEFTVLHSFAGGRDGEIPLAGLVMDAQGNLYGTTELGGGSVCSLHLGCGTVFKIDANGQETVLYSFAGGTDGSSPQSDLLVDRAGNLYGTTVAGGNSGCQGNGCGTIFKVDANGVETTLYRFTGGSDGANPVAGLVTDGAGNLFGTTDSGANGYGTVFTLRPNGKEVTLHQFSGGTDGANPMAKLIRDSHGTLYGTTRSGGNLQCPYATGFVSGCGVVFSISLP